MDGHPLLLGKKIGIKNPVIISVITGLAPALDVLYAGAVALRIW
jgi:hypothetical protein